MSDMKVFNVVLRPKRQITLPGEICERLGITLGDSLELTLEGDRLIARPKKAIALQALQEIQQAFQRAGITEKEVQKTGHRVRETITREYPDDKA